MMLECTDRSSREKKQDEDNKKSGIGEDEAYVCCCCGRFGNFLLGRRDFDDNYQNANILV